MTLNIKQKIKCTKLNHLSVYSKWETYSFSRPYFNNKKGISQQKQFPISREKIVVKSPNFNNYSVSLETFQSTTLCSSKKTFINSCFSNYLYTHFFPITFTYFCIFLLRLRVMICTFPEVRNAVFFIGFYKVLSK